MATGAGAGEGASAALAALARRLGKSPGMRSWSGASRAAVGGTAAAAPSPAPAPSATRSVLALHARWTLLAAASAESAAAQPSVVVISLLQELQASPSALWYSMVTLARSPPCKTRTPPPSTSNRRLMGAASAASRVRWSRAPSPWFSDLEQGDRMNPEISTMPDAPGQAATKL